jgi:hypothetical protein
MVFRNYALNERCLITFLGSSFLGLGWEDLHPVSESNKIMNE